MQIKCAADVLPGCAPVVAKWEKALHEHDSSIWVRPPSPKEMAQIFECLQLLKDGYIPESQP